MRFLSVGPEICLQLPSDSASRWTPLLFSYTFPTTWACSGLAPVRARPWRANKKEANPTSDRPLYYFIYCFISDTNPSMQATNSPISGLESCASAPSNSPFLFISSFTSDEKMTTGTFLNTLSSFINFVNL